MASWNRLPATTPLALNTMTNPINVKTAVTTSTVPSALGRVAWRSRVNDQGSANVPASPPFRGIRLQHPSSHSTEVGLTSDEYGRLGCSLLRAFLIPASTGSSPADPSRAYSNPLTNALN